MIQVKLFVEEEEEDLEEAVNDFLDEMDDLEILSIQFSMAQVLVDEETETNYGAMIVFRLEME